MESLLFTLKEGFEFAEWRDAHENILAEMEKCSPITSLGHPATEEALRPNRCLGQQLS
jgi:hypothetical protein